jgi:hypothetical protein
MVNAIEFTRAADFGVIAEELNRANQLHSADLKTFAKTYSDEIRGLIDLQGVAILKTVEFRARKQGIAVRYDAGNRRPKSRLRLPMQRRQPGTRVQSIPSFRRKANAATDGNR